MLRFLSGFIAIPALLAVLIFGLQNSHVVTLSLWPFMGEITLPLSILSIGFLFLGLFFGSFFMWLTMLPLRFRARRLQREVSDLNEALAEQPPVQRAASPSFPPERPQPKRRWLGGTSND